MKHVLRYLRGTTDLGLQLFRSTTSQLIAYFDADWAGCPATRRSTFGYCVFLGDNLLTWSSKCQDTLSRSSAKAEYRGVANAVAETSWIRNLLRELHTPLFTATLVYCDNVSVVYMSANPVQHQRTKHIEIDIHFVRDKVAAGHVRVLHVPSRFEEQTNPPGLRENTICCRSRWFCEKHYEKLLPIMADKYEYEKRKKEKLEEVKARLDFGDARKKITRAQKSALRRERSRSPRHEYKNKEIRRDYVFKRHECEGGGGHWKSKLRRKKSSVEDDDLSQPWKKYIRDPIVLHNIKQRDRESTEDFIQRYKSESGNVKGVPECMRISGFVHRITNPELIKRFQEKIPKTVDEMMQVATSFLQGQEAASNQERKKVPQAWRHQEGGS
ncbi:ribonuclease H-like domain-containing protein [Tanacetum coccineum]|uniref:Ribonuclease H-like domain-containing protein n=1 Tax=Tanacetum coccineum TaxID=301880 RepID=A0ABQ5AX16_9ASTR